MSFIVTFLDFSVPSIVKGCPSEVVNKLLSPLFADVNMSVGSCMSPYENPYFQAYLCWKKQSIGASFVFGTNVSQSRGEQIEIIGYALSKRLGFPETSIAIDPEARMFKVYAMAYDSLGVAIDVDLTTLKPADFKMDLPALQFKSLASPTRAQRVHLSVQNLTFSTLAVSGVREDALPGSLAGKSVFTTFPAPTHYRYALFNGTKDAYNNIQLRIPAMGGVCNGTRLISAGAEVIHVDPASVEAHADDYTTKDYTQDLQLDTTSAAEYAEMYLGPLFWPDIHHAVNAFSIASSHKAVFQQAYIHSGAPVNAGDRYAANGLTFTPVAANVNIPKNATAGYIISSENYICNSNIASYIDEKLRKANGTFLKYMVGSVRCWPTMPTPPAPPAPIPSPSPPIPVTMTSAASDAFPVWAILLIVFLPILLGIAAFFAWRAIRRHQDAFFAWLALRRHQDAAAKSVGRQFQSLKI